MLNDGGAGEKRLWNRDDEIVLVGARVDYRQLRFARRF